jgi:hypothetical protein
MHRLNQGRTSTPARTDSLGCLGRIGEYLLHHFKGGSLRSPPTTNQRK